MFLLPLLFAALASPEDQDLALRLKNHDPQAMGEIYDRFGRLAYQLIYRIVNDGAIAEDLVQETFLRIWNRIQAFDHEKGSLGAWILAVARNRAIDYLRSVDGRMQQSALELQANEHPVLFNNLERELVTSDQLRRIRIAMEKLNANQRLVIELAYYEGLSQTEMAERLKQPLGTVKTWVRSALRLLREELETVPV